VTDVDLDLTVAPEDPAAPVESNSASGTAKISVSTFGERMEYEWSELKRLERAQPSR
jgi:hypothetical protein